MSQHQNWWGYWGLKVFAFILDIHIDWGDCEDVDPNEAYNIWPNHLTAADVMLLPAFCHKVGIQSKCFVVKEAYIKNPLLFVMGFTCMAAGGATATRKDALIDDARAAKMAKNAFKEERSTIVFIESTRRKPGVVNRFGHLSEPYVRVLYAVLRKAKRKNLHVTMIWDREIPRNFFDMWNIVGAQLVFHAEVEEPLSEVTLSDAKHVKEWIYAEWQKRHDLIEYVRNGDDEDELAA